MNKKTLKNSLMIFGFIFLLGGIALGAYEIYFVITMEQSRTIGYILLATGIVALLLGMLLCQISRKISQNICLHCGSDLTGCAYEWQLLKLYDTHNVNDNYLTQNATYKITATCPKCGKKRTFTKDFLLTDYRDGTMNNTTAYVEEWCKKKFGH